MARIAIVGAGAMGSVYAGLMASAGHEVCGYPVERARASHEPLWLARRGHQRRSNGTRPGKHYY